jgi:uncharacterized surface protein with fasciclin (FAS1) repeats
MKKIIRSVLFLSLMTMGFTSCSDDDSDDVQTTTVQSNDPAAPAANTGDVSEVEGGGDPAGTLPTDVTAIAIGSPVHSTLVQALSQADLVGALQEDGPFTVFAPTNDAFVALLASNDDWNSLDDIPAEVLEAVLLNHVVADNITSSDLGNGPFETLGGQFISLEDLTAAGFTEGATDIEAQNGIVHSIESVLVPILEPITVKLVLNFDIDRSYFDDQLVLDSDCIGGEFNYSVETTGSVTTEGRGFRFIGYSATNFEGGKELTIDLLGDASYLRNGQTSLSYVIKDLLTGVEMTNKIILLKSEIDAGSRDVNGTPTYYIVDEHPGCE